MQTSKTAHYDWFLLNNRDICDKYMKPLRNKFDALQEIPETLSPNDEYENFVNIHIEAAVGKKIYIYILFLHQIGWGVSQ